jgi:phage gpG-like protein
MMSFLELTEQLERSARKCRGALEADLVEIGEAATKIAKEKIGHETPQWAPLAESTIEEKTRLGYVGRISATDPLFRRGELRESIKAEFKELSFIVGSAEKTAAYQEHGTRHIPPRPFLAPAVLEAIPIAEKVLGETAFKLLTGRERL